MSKCLVWDVSDGPSCLVVENIVTVSSMGEGPVYHCEHKVLHNRSMDGGASCLLDDLCDYSKTEIRWLVPRLETETVLHSDQPLVQ